MIFQANVHFYPPALGFFCKIVWINGLLKLDQIQKNIVLTIKNWSDEYSDELRNDDDDDSFNGLMMLTKKETKQKIPSAFFA